MLRWGQTCSIRIWKWRRCRTLLARNQRSDTVVCPPDRDAGEAVRQKIAEHPSRAPSDRGVIRQAQSACAGEIDTVGVAAGGHNARERRGGGRSGQRSPRIISFETDNQVLHSDQRHAQGADKPHLPANIDHLGTDRVHKRVHRNALRMVSLRQDAKGNFSARKRLPDDVREEYGRRYGQRVEAKFFAPASRSAANAKQEFRDWETEVAGRIAAIRSERTGEGVALTPRQARALAGEWYEWFLTKTPRKRPSQMGEPSRRTT
jgi:hypothetical protein